MIATPEDIKAAAKIIGDGMPRQIIQGQNLPDLCTHCGPLPRTLSFVGHLRNVHAIDQVRWAVIVNKSAAPATIWMRANEHDSSCITRCDATSVKPCVVGHSCHCDTVQL